MSITIGDFVKFVPSPCDSLYDGAKRCKTDHMYGLVNTMARWKEEGTLLEVISRLGDKVLAGTPGKSGPMYAFDLADLEFVPPNQSQRQFWFIVDGSVSDCNADIPDILFTRVTKARNYEEAIDMFKRDLYGLKVCCINADHLSPHTAHTYKVEFNTEEQYYVSVEGHENIALSIPVNDS